MSSTINSAEKIQLQRDTFSALLREYLQRIDAGELLEVSISRGNVKMGDVPSISTLPLIMCPAACKGTCDKYCYAAKIAMLRPSVRNAYARNTAILLRQPERYFAAVNYIASGSRFFRYNVSGDIYNERFMSEIVKAAENNPHCQFLAFTKAFRLVNDWISNNGELPANLHILFSGEEQLIPENPYNLPETTVVKKGQAVDPAWKMCGGNCFNCGCRGLGCWQAQPGDMIAFKIH